MSDSAYLEAESGPPPVAKAVAVPRISIHAFCENAETAEMLQSAAQDRRLARAHVSVQTGGVSGAVQYFDNAPTPNLLIVESHADRDQMLGELTRLAQVCDSGTKVVVIGHINDVVLYRELIREGVSEYVVAPISELQLIESIASLYNTPEAAPVGRTIAFFGARGGVGSSTIAHNVAWALSEPQQESAVIVDLDLPFGTAGLNFNQDPPQGIAEALSSPDRLDDVLLDRLFTKCGEYLNLLSAPGLIDRDFAIDEETIDHLFDVVRQNVPMIIIDLPHMWSPWVKRVLTSADDVVITATPDLASLRNAKNLIDMLKTARTNDTPPKLVINQVGVPKRPEIGPKEFAAALEIEPTLILPYEPQLFGEAANNGQMLAEVSPNARAGEGIAFLANIIAGRNEPAKQSKSLLSPLLGKFQRKKKSKKEVG